MAVLGLLLGLVPVSGCSWQRKPAAAEPPPEPPQVVVVAPVLNLSNSVDWDPQKVTDILASEFQSFPNVVVVPVNRMMAALALEGKTIVETPRDALDLARELRADATIVAAITEYDPYDPPRVGIVMQWYSPAIQEAATAFDPVAASRAGADFAPAAEISYDAIVTPLFQVQEVFSAADEGVLEDIRAYGRDRNGYDSQHGWQIHIKSQELFIRYCCWASIRSMLLARASIKQAPQEAEIKRWKQDGDV